jgi:hypothetical protein
MCEMILRCMQSKSEQLNSKKTAGKYNFHAYNLLLDVYSLNYCECRKKLSANQNCNIRKSEI